MATSSSVKRGKCDKHEHSSLQTLPSDLGLEILGRVASYSIEDISNVKLSCKYLQNLAEHDFVYKKSSLKKFACLPSESVTNEKPFAHRVESRCDNCFADQFLGTLYKFVLCPEEIYSMYRQAVFLERCRKSGNPELLYREGMVIYFEQDCCYCRQNFGLENIKRAALMDYVDAKYVYSILLMVSEDNEQRNHGFDIFNSLKTTIDLNATKQRVRCFRRGMWLRRKVNPIQDFFFCNSTICKSLNVGNNLEDKANNCDYCDADREVRVFCNV